jgi:hypothetical protein
MRRPSAARKALGFSPSVDAHWADASSIKRVPRMTALAEPVIFLSRRPTAERAADTWTQRVPISINVTIRRNRGRVSGWAHALCSLNFLLLGKTASILPNDTHFFSSEARILDRHTEQQVLVFLIVGGKGILVQHDSLNIGGAHPREVGKLLPDGCDQAGLSLHSLLVGHGHFYHSEQKPLGERPRI